MERGGELSLRPFGAQGDVVRLADIWFDASMIAHDFIGEATLSEQRPMIESVYLPMATTHVAERAGVAVGFISLLQDHVAALFVDPAYQGMGVGRALLDWAKAGHEALSLEVYTENGRAVGFYRAMGFEVESQREVDDQGQPFANARMVWRRVRSIEA